ncbi:MAG: hypothetical protein EU539_11700 [Promethearchaeota archaeon]|nr:MAG: hypothetical protein EU539_11700 [Candidatus Lokiarchaeota archaeon]
MNTTKIRIIIVIFLTMIITLSIIPVALAKPRKVYLVDYLYDCEVEDEGFSNSPEQDKDASIEATAYALEILDDLDSLTIKDLFGTVERNVNTTDLAEELEESLENRLNEGDASIYDLYYLYSALLILQDTVNDFEIGSSNEGNLEAYIDSLLQQSGGYLPRASAPSPTLSSTYHALELYDLLDESPINDSQTISWIISCKRSNAGYGGDTNSPATISNTYYAIMAMEILSDPDRLPGEGATVDYLKSFYEDDENDADDFGGFYPDDNAKHALISSTYFCVMGIATIDEDEFDNDEEEEIIAWILSHQNYQDGGFVDDSDGSDNKVSTIVNSYFAYKVLNLFDTQLESLNEEIFEAEFNWWILIIILASIGVIFVIAVIIWRKRRI